MTDHLTADDRLAQLGLVEQPRWITEVVTAAGVLLAFALLISLTYVVSLKAELDVVETERDFWLELALSPTTPANNTFRIERVGNKFKCHHPRVRYEWELAVEAECQVLAALLHMARATP